MSRLHRPTPTMPPDRCPHPDFAARVEVNRLTKEDGGPIAGYSADITVDCIGCGTPFEWMGLRPGLLPDRPMGSLDGLTMSAPLRPAGSPEVFGLDLPGYSVEAFVAEPDGDSEVAGG